MTQPMHHSPLFAGLFAQWAARHEALSALPDAPVVLDTPRRPGWVRRGSAHLIRRTGTGLTLLADRLAWPEPTRPEPAWRKPAPAARSGGC